MPLPFSVVIFFALWYLGWLCIADWASGRSRDQAGMAGEETK